MEYENYRKTIDGTAGDAEKTADTDDTQSNDNASPAPEDEAFKKELDENFPLSGGGTEPYFTDEEA